MPRSDLSVRNVHFLWFFLINGKFIESTIPVTAHTDKKSGPGEKCWRAWRLFFFLYMETFEEYQKSVPLKLHKQSLFVLLSVFFAVNLAVWSNARGGQQGSSLDEIY